MTKRRIEITAHPVQGEIVVTAAVRREKYFRVWNVTRGCVEAFPPLTMAEAVQWFLDIACLPDCTDRYRLLPCHLKVISPVRRSR